MKLSIVIPVYNEAETIEELVGKVVAVPLDKEIIIVDNCSTDGTRELIQSFQHPGLRIILQDQNRMKGNSVRKGIAAAKGEYLVIQDGDLEYNPQDFVPMLDECEKPDVLAVLGSRVLGARRGKHKMPTSSYSVGREFIDRVFRLLYASDLTDTATCYKMAATETFQSLDLHCNSFDLDFELAAKLTLLARQRGMRVAQIPIDYFPRSIEEGKKIRWHDGLQALRTIWRARFAEPTKPGPKPDAQL
jgi:dolichol-phosphate mannosyltransferase